MTEAKTMKINELLNDSAFRIINLANGEREIDGVYIGDLLSWVMKNLQCDNAWLTIMSNINILAVASLADASVIILCEGVELDEKVLETAKEKEINVLTTNLGAYEVACKLHGLLKN